MENSEEKNIFKAIKMADSDSEIQFKVVNEVTEDGQGDVNLNSPDPC